jgi:hypothetical protein
MIWHGKESVASPCGLFFGCPTLGFSVLELGRAAAGGKYTAFEYAPYLQFYPFFFNSCY